MKARKNSRKKASPKKANPKFDTTRAIGVAFLILLEAYVLLVLARLSESIAALYPLIIPCVLVLAYVFIQMYKHAKKIPRAKEGIPFEKLHTANKMGFFALFLLIGVLSVFMIAMGLAYGGEYILPLIIGLIGVAFLASKALKKEWRFELGG